MYRMIRCFMSFLIKQCNSKHIHSCVLQLQDTQICDHTIEIRDVSTETQIFFSEHVLLYTSQELDDASDLGFFQSFWISMLGIEISSHSCTRQDASFR